MVEVKLKVQAGSNAGKEIPVPMARFLIGRSDECQLRPKSDAISRNHCAILISDDEVTVRDLNSRNGTFINGERVSGDEPLKNGDMLRVGKLEFEVLIQGKTKLPQVPAPDTKSDKKSDDGSSVEFDVSEWLEEANAVASQKRSDPDTRQFKLDETDRIALENAASGSASTGDSGVKKPPEKKPPGKLPDRQKQAAANSREAAADMLKKFFNNK